MDSHHEDRSWVSIHPPTNHLAALPFEIQFMILGYIPLPSRIALALTSKTFFAAYYPSRIVPAQPENELTYLLALLEKDDPTRFLCFDCTRLCPLSHQKNSSCNNPARYMSMKWYSPEIDRFRSYLPWTGIYRPRQPVPAKTYSIHLHLHSWRPEIKGPVITFPEAHLVMNRYLYGASCGLPLQTLEYCYEFERFINLHNKVIGDHFPLSQHQQGRRPRTRSFLLQLEPIQRRKPRHSKETLVTSTPLDRIIPWKFRHTSTAKVIDSELYVVRSHHITGPPVTLGKFIKLLNSLELPICRHMTCSEYLSSCPYRGGYLRIPSDDWNGGEYPASFQPLGSCPRCPTNYVVLAESPKETGVTQIKHDIARLESLDDHAQQTEAEQTGWSFELTTYHLLGSCRTPDDRIWKSLVSLDGESPRRRGWIGRIWNRMGVIKKWHCSHGEEIKNDWQWVNNLLNQGPLRWRDSQQTN